MVLFLPVLFLQTKHRSSVLNSSPLSRLFKNVTKGLERREEFQIFLSE